MSQPDLFYENFYEALSDDVKAVGGLKAVGKLFYPEKDAASAGRALADKLNPERRERLTDEQERLIIRQAREARGFSAALCFICDDTGFERPRALNPENEQARLQREFIAAVHEAKHLGDRLERLTQPPLQAVK